MGQAKARKQEINEMKSGVNNVVVVMPLQDTKLYGKGTAGDYIKENKIRNACITGSVGSEAGEIQAFLLVTNSMSERDATAAMQTWYEKGSKPGPRFAMWVPLNDMKEVIISNEKYAPVIGWLLRETGIANMFAEGMRKAMDKNPELRSAFKNIGMSWGPVDY
jgi:hypothetical protein